MTEPTLITIDSNVVIGCYERWEPDACALNALHPERITLQVANRTPDREAGLWAGNLATLNVRRRGGLFRLDISRLDGDDVIAGDADVARIRQIEDSLFPRGLGANPNELLSRISDVDILDTHLRSEAAFFVTEDSHFLTRRSALRERLRVVVLTPDEALRELKSRAA